MSLLLKALAQDIRDNLECDCYIDDLPGDQECPCGGSGREEGGADGAYEGCWKCQAIAALAPRDRRDEGERPMSDFDGKCPCDECERIEELEAERHGIKAINADLSEALRVAREEGERLRGERDLAQADLALSRSLHGETFNQRDEARRKLGEARELLRTAPSDSREWRWKQGRDAWLAANAPKDASAGPRAPLSSACCDLSRCGHREGCPGKAAEAPPLVAAPEVATLAHGQSKQPVAPPTPGPIRAAPDLSALARGEPCTCGSGLHPRRCVIHPDRYRQHCDEISAENADVPAKECELCEVCGSEWGHFVMCGATEEYRVALSKRRMALARSVSDRPLRPSTATKAAVVACEQCRGSGGYSDEFPVADCPKCDGTGIASTPGTPAKGGG